MKIGDRVLCISPPDHDSSYVGMEGVVFDIVESPFDSLPICVDFGNNTWRCERNSLIMAKVVPVQERVAAKCKKLWNNSNYVKTHPTLVY